MKTKKILSLILSLLMIMTVIPMTAIESDAASNYETEDNDTYASANALPLNSSISGCLSSSNNDDDVYKITTPQNGKLTLTFTHTYEESAECWDICIYQYKDGEYIEILADDVSLNYSKEIYSLAPIGAVAGGVYYIKISADSFSYNIDGKEYGLTNSFYATEYYEKELNNSYSTATKLTFNNTYNGSISDSYDVDVYEITAPQNGKLSLTFTHKYAENSGYWYIYVYQYKDGQYTQLLNRQCVYFTSSERCELMPIGAVEGGVYYIRIEHGSNVECYEYGLESAFTATEYYERDANDSYATATKMTYDNTYKGCLSSSNDTDVYEITAAKSGKLSLTFTHQSVEESGSWNIDVYKYENGEYVHLFDTVYLYLNDKGIYQLTPIDAVANGVYYIKIDYFSEVSGYEYGLTVSEIIPEPTPKVANKNGYVAITWSESEGANGYYVYRKAPGETSWKKIGDVTGTSFSDKNVKSGTDYTYTVKAYNDSTESSYSSEVAIKYLAQPTVKTANKNGCVAITWSKSAGAKGYYVYRKAPGETSWKKIGNVTGTSFNDKNVKSGTNYKYTVKAYNGSTYSSYHSGVTIKYLAQPTVKTANKKGYVAITWSKTAGAKGYYVYRKGPNDTKWVRIANVTGTSFNDKNVKSGTNYKYTVKAYNGSTFSSYNSGIAIKYLAQPTFKVANKSSYVSVSWNKTAGAKGYYVYRKGPNDTKWVKIANVTGTSYADKKVKKNVKYTYTVKAYNGSYNSAYHSGVTVKH